VAEPALVRSRTFVDEVQARLAVRADLVRRGETVDPATRAAIHRAAGGALPLLRAHAHHGPEIAAAGLPEASQPAGRCLGVFRRGDEAWLAWLTVELTGEGGASATPAESATPAALTEEAVESLHHAAHVAARLYPHHWPLCPRHDLRFGLLDLRGEPVADLDERIGGGSFGLSALLATWSCLTGRPLPPGLVTTGALARDVLLSDARVLGVGGIRAKWTEAEPLASEFLLPRACQDRVSGSSRLHPVGKAAEALRAAFGADWCDPRRCRLPPAHDPRLALEALDVAYWENGDGLRWSELAERFEALAAADALPREGRALAQARAGACWTHCNAQERAERCLAAAVQAVEEVGPDAIEGQVEVQTLIHLAVVQQDGYRLGAAERSARLALDLAGRLRLHRLAVNARSTLGQILTAAGRPADGLPLVAAARDHYDDVHSPECPRNHTYVVDALCRAGRLDDAEAEYALALEHLDRRAPRAQRRRSRAFLDYALLDGRLRALRRAEPDLPDSEWAALAERTEGALVSLESDWPRTGLLRVRDAARLRAARDKTEALVAEALRRGEGLSGQPILRWHCALVGLEAALADLRCGPPGGAASDTTRLVVEAARWIPGEAARELFAPWLGGLEADRATERADALMGILEAEQH